MIRDIRNLTAEERDALRVYETATDLISKVQIYSHGTIEMAIDLLRDQVAYEPPGVISAVIEAIQLIKKTRE